MNYNVLVVDDENNILSSINRLLVRKHFSVFTVQSGDDALKLIETKIFAVIITDQRMPGMSGIELLQAVKMIAPDTVRILMTGFADKDMLMDAINKGNVMQVVSKPWSDSALVDAVNNGVCLFNLKEENEQLTKQVQEQNQQLTQLNTSLEERVAERNLAMYDLDQSNKLLEQANNLKRDILSTLSHELRGPVGSMLSLSDMMQKGSVELAEALPMFKQACQHQLDLVEDILDYASLDEDGHEVVREPVDIDESVKVVYELAQIEARKNNISIEIEASLTNHTIALDKTKFRQIMLNILYNAVKYSPQDGTITLSVWDQDDGDAGVRLYIAIKDEGPGISHEEAEMLFSPYEQLSNRVKSRDKGYGLGLSIAQKMTELQGGEIGLEEECDHGCCFIVCFPYQ